MFAVRSAPRCLLPTLAACLIAFALALPAHAAGNVYYVSPSGSDNNNGSAAFPFRQIRRALEVVAPGDTVLIADGDYLGFDVAVEGTAGAPITLQAVGSGAKVVPTADRSDNRDTIKISFASYVVIDGLTSFQANRAAVRIDSSPHVTIRNCIFGNNAVWGIFTDFSDDTLLENNECYGSVQQHGIYVSNSSERPVIRRNHCHDNHDCGIQINADASEGGTGLTLGALIEKNVVHDNGVGGGSAINLDGVQDSMVVNNLLYNNHASGIACFQIDGTAGPKGMGVYFNTVDMPAGSRWALHFSESAGPNTARNNILLNASAVHGGLTYGDATDVASLDSDYNILDRVTPDDGDTVDNLATWQSLGHELHSFSAAAASLFVNPGTDYHLLPNAPAIDHGQTLASVTTDIEGDPRPTGAASDIGCDEYSGGGRPQPPPAPANLTAMAGNGQVALSWSASVGAASYAVSRSLVSGGPYTPLASNVTTTSYTDHAVTNGKTYHYVVAAVNGSGTSANSNEASATPTAPPPPAPNPPTLLKATGGRGRVALSWKQSTSAGIMKNRVYRSRTTGGPYTLRATLKATTAYADTKVAARTTYYYVVTAVNRSGVESAFSSQAAATTR